MAVAKALNAIFYLKEAASYRQGKIRAGVILRLDFYLSEVQSSRLFITLRSDFSIDAHLPLRLSASIMNRKSI
tara:strand:- start:6421 stop:6639 length:219 start_codon:yes stop_codon:yes gene_type:complete